MKAATKISLDLATSILGSDFITPEEITKSRPGIVYTDEQITTLAKSVPSKDLLNWCKVNDYAIIPSPHTEMSTIDIFEMQSTNFKSDVRNHCLVADFAHKHKTSFGWLLIKKTPVLNSPGKTWNEQNELLSVPEKVPNSAEMSWFITTYLEVHNINLFKSTLVRTSSFDSNDQHVYVGQTCPEELRFLNGWDRCRSLNIGLSAIRRI